MSGTKCQQCGSVCGRFPELTRLGMLRQSTELEEFTRFVQVSQLGLGANAPC